MASKKGKTRLKESLAQLQTAITAYKRSDGDEQMEFLALSKAFEVAVEHAWRELKMRVEDEGLDAPSPKAAIKQAAKLGFISDVEDWLAAIDARNDSVHDYFGIPESNYASLAGKFLKLCQSIV